MLMRSVSCYSLVQHFLLPEAHITVTIAHILVVRERKEKYCCCFSSSLYYAKLKTDILIKRRWSRCRNPLVLTCWADSGNISQVTTETNQQLADKWWLPTWNPRNLYRDTHTCTFQSVCACSRLRVQLWTCKPITHTHTHLQSKFRTRNRHQSSKCHFSCHV